METIGRIRREYFLKGKAIKEIARDLRVSRNTVRKVVRSGATSFAYDRDVQPRPKLGRWTAELDALLPADITRISSKVTELADCLLEVAGELDRIRAMLGPGSEHGSLGEAQTLVRVCFGVQS